MTRTPYPARAARLRAGRSLEETAQAARISVSTLRKLECGYPAAERVARRLARFYGCGEWPFRRHRPRRPALRGVEGSTGMLLGGEE